MPIKSSGSKIIKKNVILPKLSKNFLIMKPFS